MDERTAKRGAIDTPAVLGAVIEHLHASMKDSGNEPFDSVRDLFMEGRPIYDGSGFLTKTYLQICVRNPNCIKGFFDPRKPNRRYRIS